MVFNYEVKMSEPSNQPLQMRQIFGIPIFRKKFDLHDAFKEQALVYLKDKENFRKYTSRPSLLFTSSNLHKEEVFKPYSEFFIHSLKEVMESIGFEPDIALTGMWGTVHPNNGYHHRHTHYNSFLAGVFYFDGNEQCAGTTFFNTNVQHNIIVPKLKDRRPHASMIEYTVPFEEGTLVIFPAWLPHHTAHNNLSRTNSYRKILSFNSMPVGATNNDLFDRYSYSDVSNNEDLPVTLDQLLGRENYNNWGLIDNEPYFTEQKTKEEGQ